MENTTFGVFGKRYRSQRRGPHAELEEIGAGGMGRVYKVYDTVRAQYLALKELSRRYVDSPKAILRFKNEFRIMSQFQHPNMVEVFEFGISEQKIPFITMELVAGQDLSALVQPSVEQVVEILTQTCQVLAFIHSRLYVHRDLKPDNIKVLADGSIKLLDYGLMSQLGVPASPQISGTYYYLAPEVIVGGIIDESTDLYSLGIIGYELLTGERPFTGSKKQILQGHLNEMPPEPITLRPGVPASLNAIIMKLLAKGKEQRYRNGAAVLQDLQLVSGPNTVRLARSQLETTAQMHSYLYSSKLIGRATEITRFQASLEQLTAGQSGSLFVGAPSGMGKTRLLHEMKIIASLAAVQSLYLESASGAGEQIYSLVAGLLRHMLPLSEEQEIQQYGPALAHLSDEVGQNVVQETSLPSDDEISASLLAWLGAVTQKVPLVLFLDDVQWLDLKSVQLLNEVIRHQAQLKVLIVAGFRNDEVDKTSPLWHTPEEGLSDYLELSSLDKAQTRTLLENLLYPTTVSSEFLTYCFNNCGGNVFDLLEFLRYMVTEGLMTRAGNHWLEPVNLETLTLPRELSERLLLRMNKLSPTAKAIAGVASVLEDDLNLESWQAVSQIDEPLFFKAIDELVQHQIIIKVEDDYQFSHDKIRQTLYESLSEAQKQADHLQAAKFFEAKLPENQRRLMPTIARHFIRAEAGRPAIDYSLQVARAAEQKQAEWEAFDYYRAAARFLEADGFDPEQALLLLEIYEKAAQFSSAAWGDASTCLSWLQKAIDFYSQEQNNDKVFDLSLSYIATSAITSNYQAARRKIEQVIQANQIAEGSLLWAVLHGAGVCLVDWYQGYQNDCFAHAVAAIDIFESQLDSLPNELFPVYSWALFWREKARAYTGQPIEMANIEKIRQMMEAGQSDLTIYWHTLTAVGARAAFTGRWHDLLEWKALASQLSRQMGKIYWFECWISHSYLYGALQHGEFSQLKNHIERVEASPDPYQVRLAYLFQARLHLVEGRHAAAEASFKRFFEAEEENCDNSYLEGFIFLAKTYLERGALDKAQAYIEKGTQLASAGQYENPFYQLQLWQLNAELAIAQADYSAADAYLAQSLALAEKLDTPIQAAFIHKSWAMMHLKQTHLELATQHLTQAKEIFLALENKYQAAQVIALLDKLPQPKEERARQKKAEVEQPESLFTVVEDEPTSTKAEEELMATQAEEEMMYTQSDEELMLTQDELMLTQDELMLTQTEDKIHLLPDINKILGVLLTAS